MQLGLKSVGAVHRVTEEKVLRKYDLYKSLNVAKRRAVTLSESGYCNSVLTEETLAFPVLGGIQLHVQSPTSKAKLGKLGK